MNRMRTDIGAGFKDDAAWLQNLTKRVTLIRTVFSIRLKGSANIEIVRRIQHQPMTRIRQPQLRRKKFQYICHSKPLIETFIFGW